MIPTFDIAYLFWSRQNNSIVTGWFSRSHIRFLTQSHSLPVTRSLALSLILSFITRFLLGHSIRMSLVRSLIHECDGIQMIFLVIYDHTF